MDREARESAETRSVAMEVQDLDDDLSYLDEIEDLGHGVPSQPCSKPVVAAAMPNQQGKPSGREIGWDAEIVKVG